MMQLKKEGFTLVEILIVTVIIGILAGMMMIMMGAAADSADAIRLVNDLRLLKSASVAYLVDDDEIEVRKLPLGGSEPLAKSLERYLDKPLTNGYNGKVYVIHSNDRSYFGLVPSNPKFGHNTGVLKKIEKVGIVYDEDGNQFKAGGAHDTGPYYVIIK
jgi:general secretion pathway protein G